MAFRQLIFIRGLSGFRNQSSYFLNPHRRNLLNKQNTNFTRNIRRKIEHNDNNLKRRINTSPFDNFMEPQFIKKDTLWKSFVFTISFSVGSFVGVSILEYERIRAKAIRALRNATSFSWFKRDSNNNTRGNDLQSDINKLKRDIKNAWNSMSAAERVYYPILALNTIVFALWRVPRFQPMLLKYFVSNPAAKAVCWPMFLSTFSHYSLFHLFANMYVLHSFCHGAVNSLGQEQFLGLYLSAGVVASFTSHLYKIALHQPGFSLGASGAIMAILAYVCARYPDTKLSILFLPQFQFSAGSAIMTIVGIDLAGVLFGWRFFDHAAHLGGALMGFFWCTYGSQNIWPLREHIVGFWHDLRGKTK